MAEAGWPLRTETFYYSHRKGGPQVLPVDVPAFLRSLLPRPADDDYRYLAEHTYEMGSGFKAAIVQTDALKIRALPAARSSTTASRSSRSPVRPPSSPGWSRWSSCSTTGSRSPRSPTRSAS